MTTYAQATATCVHCGSANTMMMLASTNSFGSMDLDMRPPPMKRHTLAQAIQQCQSCGYCAPDLEERVGTREALDALAYRSILSDGALPELARKFAAFAHLAEGSGRISDAAWACLHAAWACDDTSDGGESAKACRRSVLRLMEALHAEGQTMTDDRNVDATLELDLLRRSGQLDEVLVRAETLSRGSLPEILRQICACQARLAGMGDTSCHQVDEATG